MGMKVGELYAELDLVNNLDKKMEKAESTFKSTAKDMDADAKIDLDVSNMMRKLDDIEREVDQTTKDISRHQPKVDGSKIPEGIKKGMDGAQDAVSAGIGPLGDILAGGLAGIGVAGGAALYEAFGMTIERQKGRNKLAIQLGLSPEQAKVAGEASASVYAQGFGDSLEHTNEAFRFVAQNIGGLGGSADDIDNMTKSVLTLSDAFGVDLEKTTDAVAQMLNTGLAKDGKQALDILARGFRVPRMNADMLLDSFIEYSTQFRQLGLSGPQALGMISQGLRGGARDADIGADALKEFAIRSQDMAVAGPIFAQLGLDGWKMSHAIAQGGPVAQMALQKTIEKVNALQDPVTRSTVSVELFGTQAEDLQKALGAMNTTTAVAEVGNLDGAMQQANNSTTTSASGFESWRRSMELNVTSFIDSSVIPALGRLADKYHEFFGDDSGENLRRGAAILNGTDNGGHGNWWGDWGANAVVSATPIGSLAKGIFGFDDGGTVPGPIGAPQIVMAHGGERISPDHKRPTRNGSRRDVTVVKVGTAELARVERKHDKAWS